MGEMTESLIKARDIHRILVDRHIGIANDGRPQRSPSSVRARNKQHRSPDPIRNADLGDCYISNADTSTGTGIVPVPVASHSRRLPTDPQTLTVLVVLSKVERVMSGVPVSLSAPVARRSYRVPVVSPVRKHAGRLLEPVQVETTVLVPAV